MRNNRKERKYTPEQLVVLQNLAIPRDIASMMIDVPEREVSDFRFRIKYKKSILAAAKKYRDQRKLKDEERLGGRQYNYWTPEEITYIMTSEDSDVTMAEKLGRTVYSIQKKRERELNKNNKNNKKKK